MGPVPHGKPYIVMFEAALMSWLYDSRVLKSETMFISGTLFCFENAGQTIVAYHSFHDQRSRFVIRIILAEFGIWKGSIHESIAERLGSSKPYKSSGEFERSFSNLSVLSTSIWILSTLVSPDISTKMSTEKHPCSLGDNLTRRLGLGWDVNDRCLAPKKACYSD